MEQKQKFIQPILEELIIQENDVIIASTFDVNDYNSGDGEEFAI